MSLMLDSEGTALMRVALYTAESDSTVEQPVAPSTLPALLRRLPRQI